MDELDALKTIDAAMSDMDAATRLRTFQWLAAKYSLTVPSSPVDAVGPPKEEPTRAASSLRMTVKAVATTLGSETGSDLAVAAAAFLTLVEGREVFTRQQLLDAMKSGVGFYKPTYRSNLSGYITSLCKGNTLIEVSDDAYAIKAPALRLLSKQLQESA